MNNTYLVERPTIVELLDQIEAFQERMDKFNDKYDNPYKYSINIYSEKEEGTQKMWLAKVNIEKNEYSNYIIS